MPPRIPFILGTLFEDPGLFMPDYCALSLKEQERIRYAVNDDWRKRRDVWETMSESEHFVDRLAFLFKVCTFHKHHWDSQGKAGQVFWNRVRRSAQWTQWSLTLDTVRKLTILLFDARMRRILAPGGDNKDLLRPVSSAIEAFYEAMKDRFPQRNDYESWLRGIKDDASQDFY